MSLRKFPRVSILSISILIAIYVAGCSSTGSLSSGSSSSGSSGSSSSGSSGSSGSGSQGSGSSTITTPTTNSALVNTYTPSSTSAISPDFFGMTIHYLVPTTSHPVVTPYPSSYAVSTFRLWDVVNWSTIESRYHNWSWTKLDSVVSIAKQNNVSDFVWTFGTTPAWAAINPSDPCLGPSGTGLAASCSVPDMTAFDEFVKTFVQRECGVIKYYEPWNEPDLTHFWDGNNQQLLTIAEHVYSIAKDPANCGCTDGICSPNGGENPNMVMTPTVSAITSSQLAWLQSYLSSAGSTYPYADITTFHGYDAPAPEQIIPQIAQLKTLFAQFGLGGLPVWNTEASWGHETSTQTDAQVSWLMRYHLTQLVSGVSRFIWYAYDNCAYGTLYVNPSCGTGIGSEGSQTVAGDSYPVIEQWLTGATLNQCTSYQNGLWMCELTRSNGYTAWMLWSTTSSSVSVSIPHASGLTVYRDSQNNVSALPSQISVNSMPVLLETTDL